MGLSRANIYVENAKGSSPKGVDLKMLVDSGSIYMVLPANVAFQLALDEYETKEVVLADGSVRKCPYVGPLKVVFESRICFTGAIVMGNEPTLGCIQMEDMDLVVLPKIHTLAVNPDSPNIATAYAKTAK